MTPILHGYWRSSASWRIRWAFELKRIPYVYNPINLLKAEHQLPEHLARNPMGALPVLEVRPGTCVAQSMAILMWLEESFAKTPYFFGQDRTQRYKIIEVCELINADTAPLQNMRVQKHVQRLSDESQKMEWSRHYTRYGLNAFQKNIEKFAGRYCFGDQITAADLFLIPQMYNARRFEIPFDEFSTLKRIWENCINTPECLKSSPEQQSDATSAP